MTNLSWLPNFFVAGAPKSGTSSVYTWIAAHPDAFGSIDKETYFFVDPGTHMFNPEFNIANGLNTYRDQFPIPAGSQPRIILEATPSYMYSQAALSNVPELSSRPICLFVVRDPAEQVYSVYNYFRTNWNWIPHDLTFEKYLTAVQEGNQTFGGNEIAQNAIAYARYINYLRPWKEKLGSNRMMVVTFEELKTDASGLIRRASSWLGLNPSFYKGYGFPVENETYVARNQALQEVNIALRSRLPKGRAYTYLRSLYRRLNTFKQSGPSDLEQELINDLRRCFADDNDRLAESFSLEVSSWKT